MQSEAVHREVPKDKAAAKSSGALTKWHTGRHLAAERRQKPKERARKKLVAAAKKMNRRAGVIRHKGHGKNNVARGAPKGRMREKRPWKNPGMQNGNEGPRHKTTAAS
jgi:hypothetical protein